MSISKKFKLIIITGIITILGMLLIFNLKNPQKEVHYKIDAIDSIQSEHFARVLSDLMGPPLTSGNKVLGLYNGEQIFPAMLKAIESAQKTITFESYIYWSGDIGKKFSDALSARARAGVKVHVLVDWVGSTKIDEAYVAEMKEAHVEVERYHALSWYNLSRLNNRTHRKILVVDGRIGFTGGVGIADEWNGNGLKSDQWRDTHFQVEGPVVAQMQAAFMDNWLKLRPEVHQAPEYFPVLEPQGESYAQMFKSSSGEGGSSVRLMYLLAIASARKSIYLESAYFIPDSQTIDDLVKARARGVEVQIIVPGPYTDSIVVRHASRGQWEKLLQAGVKFFEYQPALFHCKVLIIDQYFVSVGSTNFDERSFRLNDEANLNILDADFASKEYQAFVEDLKRSKVVTLEAWMARPKKDKIIEKISALMHSQL
ncbi:MAG: cardiolipin synthase [Bdellovibrionaceae bacterium]|nr:cardiolipin synthase [Bdellovibrio sp.]